MIFDVLTLFPTIIHAYTGESIIKRAIEKEIITVNVYNIRDYTKDKHRQVDDYPYGGGSGMILKIEPLYNAITEINRDSKERHTILFSPEGRLFTQKVAEEFSNIYDHLLLICGRYEGIDERIKHFIDEEISVGDYILTGGELPALVIIDAITRLLPGVLGDENSSREESFTTGLLEYPQYTRPVEFKGMNVPEILLSGNHKLIKRWKRKEALRRTLKNRPDLLKKIELSEEDRELLKEIKEEERWV